MEVCSEICDKGKPVVKAVDEGEHNVFEGFVKEGWDFDDEGFFHYGTVRSRWCEIRNVVGEIQ